MFLVSCVSWAAQGPELLPSPGTMLIQVLGTMSLQPADGTESSWRNSQEVFMCQVRKGLSDTSGVFHWPEHGHMAQVTAKDAGKCSPPRRKED